MSFLTKLQNKLHEISSPVPSLHVQQEVVYPIRQVNVNNLIDPNDALNAIYEYKIKYPVSYTTNVFAWRSAYNTHKQTRLFDPIINVFESIGNDFISSLRECDRVHSEIKVINLWAMIYSMSDYARWHHHGSTTLSMVYYVDVAGDSAPIQFHCVNSDIVSVVPRQGDILFFNGNVKHRVPKIKNNSPRAVIAANLFSVKT